MYIATTLVEEVAFTYQSQNLALVSVLLDFQVQSFLIRYQQKRKEQNRFLLLSFLLNPTIFGI
jgi:seryl-tRNA synthetase